MPDKNIKTAIVQKNLGCAQSIILVEEGENPVLTEETTVVEEEKKELTDEEKAEITQKVNESIEAYKTYLNKNPDAKEKDSIERRIDSLTAELDFNSEIQ